MAGQLPGHSGKFLHALGNGGPLLDAIGQKTFIVSETPKAVYLAKLENRGDRLDWMAIGALVAKDAGAAGN